MKSITLAALLMLIVLTTKAQLPVYKFKYQIDSIQVNDKSPGRFAVLPLYYSMIGEYQLDLKVYDHNRHTGDMQPVPSSKKRIFKKYHPIHAAQYIIEQAKKTSIVIINEGHNHPDHRAFVSGLLPQLKKIGYNYLGIEALEYSDSGLNSRKYPLIQPLSYTNDPRFGNMIRMAHSLGYTIFPYEAIEGKNNKEREIEQAENIVRVIKGNPSAKFVIYCGYDHAIEDSLKNWGLAMAGRVKRLTGIDPLTIDQVQLTETSDPSFDYPYRRLINLDYSAVFVDDKDNAFNKANETKTFDVNVYHPQTQYRNGRPVWLKGAGDRYIDISKKVNIGFPCLVFAYKADDDMEKAVPVDVIELDTKTDIKDLVLPQGPIKIKLVDTKGRRQIIKIK